MPYCVYLPVNSRRGFRYNSCFIIDIYDGERTRKYRNYSNNHLPHLYCYYVIDFNSSVTMDTSN